MSQKAKRQCIGGNEARKEEAADASDAADAADAGLCDHLVGYNSNDNEVSLDANLPGCSKAAQRESGGRWVERLHIASNRLGSVKL